MEDYDNEFVSEEEFMNNVNKILNSGVPEGYKVTITFEDYVYILKG
jgi:hypothetical protein